MNDIIEINAALDAALVPALAQFPDTTDTRLALGSLFLQRSLELFQSRLGVEGTRLLVSDALAELGEK